MYRLRKTQEPLGTKDEPQYERSYSEGLIPVVDGICDVRLPETRDRLLKFGYEDVTEAYSKKTSSTPLLEKVVALSGRQPGHGGKKKSR